MISQDEIRKLMEREELRSKLLKEEGNDAFKVGDYAAAYRLYSKALVLAPPLGQHLPSLWQLRTELFSNRALAAYRLGWFWCTVADCTSSICENRKLRDVMWDPAEGRNIGPKSANLCNAALLNKAHNRRATAWAALGFPKRAAQDRAVCQGKAASDLLEDGKGPSSFPQDQDSSGCRRSIMSSSGGSSSSSSGFCSGWERLPDEPRQLVFHFLPGPDIGKLAAVCADCRRLGQAPDLWRQEFTNFLGPLIAPPKAQIRLPKPLDRLLSRCYKHRSPGRGFLQAAPPLVLDIGQGYTKNGVAVGSTPSATVINFAAISENDICCLGRFTGNLERLRHFLVEVMYKRQGFHSDKHPVILCLNNHSREFDEHYEVSAKASVSRAKKALVDLECPKVIPVHSAVLALLAHQRDTGVVIDIGLGATRVLPVVRGQLQERAVTTQLFGSANGTNYLLSVLANVSEGGRPPGDLSGFQIMMVAKVVKEDEGYVASSSTAFENAEERKSVWLSSIFNQSVQVGRPLAVLGEMFFNPTLTGPHHSYFGPNSEPPRLGLHEMVSTALARLPPEIRQELLSSVVVIGGTSALPGMQQRLQTELEDLCSNTKKGSCLLGLTPTVLEVIPEAAWRGGALLGSAIWYATESHYNEGDDDDDDGGDIDSRTDDDDEDGDDPMEAAEEEERGASGSMSVGDEEHEVAEGRVEDEGFEERSEAPVPASIPDIGRRHESDEWFDAEDGGCEKPMETEEEEEEGEEECRDNRL